MVEAKTHALHDKTSTESWLAANNISFHVSARCLTIFRLWTMKLL